MYEERRLEEKRMAIEKSIEVIGSDGEPFCSGRTDNLSDAGIGAYFNGMPALDSEVLLRIFWDSGRTPVEQSARVIWSEADDSGGARVGLKVASEGAPATNETVSDAAPQAPLPPATIGETFCLELGRPVVMSTGGVAIETVVSDIGAIQSDHTVQVVLRITDDAFIDPAETQGEETPAEEQDWSPHPFRDAWRTVVRYAAPVLGFLLTGAKRGSAVAARWSTNAAGHLPEPVKARGRSMGRAVLRRLLPITARVKAAFHNIRH